MHVRLLPRWWMQARKQFPNKSLSMKILAIRPIDLQESSQGSPLGTIDIVYKKQSGFMWWRRSEVVVRGAFRAAADIWRWTDEPASNELHYNFVKQLADAHAKDLLAGKTIKINPEERL